MLFVFGKFDYLGWGGDRGLAARAGRAGCSPGRSRPARRSSGSTSPSSAVLFLAQAGLGGAIAHYRVEPGGFYGFDLARLLPYTLARTWHLQLAVFWIATAWVAGGLFLAPLVGGAEPKGQRTGVLVLLGALAVVVFGSLFGEMAGINNRLGNLWFWLGPPGQRVPRPGAFLAAPAGGGTGAVARPHVPRPPAGDEGRPAGRAAVAVPLRGGGHPRLLRPRPVLRPAHELRGHRQLALLDHPSLGGGLLRAVRHGAGRGDVPPARAGHRPNRRRGWSTWMPSST